MLLQSACILALLAVATFSACKRSASSSSSVNTDQPANATAPTGQSANRIDLRQPVVQIETSHGRITASLDGVRAPGTVRNFLNYANEGFYDNTIVHYVDPGNMIVSGGYDADRRPKPAHAPIRNEAHNGLKNTRGTLAMARDPARIDSATTQFFINLADAPQRDHTGSTPESYGYCVFGNITEGLEVANKIANSPTTNLSGDLEKTPNPPVIIKSIRVVR